MGDRLLEALSIVGVGLVGVFTGLALIMTAVYVLGRIYGKKPAAKVAKKDAPAASGTGA